MVAVVQKKLKAYLTTYLLERTRCEILFRLLKKDQLTQMICHVACAIEQYAKLIA
jgi:hypothetical protein